MAVAGATAAVTSVAAEQTETAALPAGLNPAPNPAKVKFYSNCWLWAFYNCFRRGGFLIISKSAWGWWPHVMWSPDMVSCHQFEPEKPRVRGLLFPPLIYRGYIKISQLRQ